MTPGLASYRPLVARNSATALRKVFVPMHFVRNASLSTKRTYATRCPKMDGQNRERSISEAHASRARETPQHVVALLSNPEDRRRVRETLGDRTRLEFCERSAELFRLTTDLQADVVIADSSDVDGRRTAPALHALRAARPLLQVVLYIELSAPAVRNALEGWSTGVVFRHEEEIAPALRTAIVRAPRAGSPGALLATSATLTPPGVRRFFTHCAWRASVVDTARAAAEGVGIPYRTLSRQLDASALPSPKAVLAWYRLLHAAWRMELLHQGREIVAKQSGFSSGVVLAKTLRRYANLSWTQLREEVGFNGLLTRFEALLRAPATRPIERRVQPALPVSRSSAGRRTDRISGSTRSHGERRGGAGRPACMRCDPQGRGRGVLE